ncbi:hypothetical protein NDU88_003353 [Pleurodeles waltl]|uniref:Uncharacterized protein n=1 Tax=Pleurodeles waltl TaxID=8319 RepID=A0AAV7UY73_PLEWA|nr:hypothetical protein NDU88_003353 [Pleurodeles waltl]
MWAEVLGAAPGELPGLTSVKSDLTGAPEGSGKAPKAFSKAISYLLQRHYLFRVEANRVQCQHGVPGRKPAPRAKNAWSSRDSEWQDGALCFISAM